MPELADRERWAELFGGYRETLRLMAQRTAEMHRALAADPTDPAFAPEPHTRLHQRSHYQSMRNLTGRLCARLVRDRHLLPEPARELSRQLLARQEEILARFKAVLDLSIDGFLIRCHGNYHLAQLLYTGNNFVVIDFAGDVSKVLSERRLKRPPLLDVATMVRSLSYVASSALFGLAHPHGRPPGVIREEDRQVLEPWTLAWANRAAREFVTEYISHIESAGLLPTTEEGRRALLDSLLLEKALQEIASDLTYRPAWVVIPLRGALRLLG